MTISNAGTVSNSTDAVCRHAWYTVAAFQEHSTTAGGAVYHLRERCVHCGITRNDPFTVAPV